MYPKETLQCSQMIHSYGFVFSKHKTFTPISFTSILALTETSVVLPSPQVEITLQDVNDNPPIFPNDILDVTIEENVGDGFRIMQLTATDADEVTAPQVSVRPRSVFAPVLHLDLEWLLNFCFALSKHQYIAVRCYL